MLNILQISIIVFVFWTLGTPEHIFNFYFRAIEKLPKYLYKPLGGCYKCLTGQVLFHFYWITHLHNYNIIDQLFYPACGILIVTLLNYLYDKAEKN